MRANNIKVPRVSFCQPLKVPPPALRVSPWTGGARAGRGGGEGSPSTLSRSSRPTLNAEATIPTLHLGKLRLKQVKQPIHPAAPKYGLQGTEVAFDPMPVRSCSFPCNTGQGSARSGPWAQTSRPPAFVNRVFLGHSHAICFHTARAGLSSCGREAWPGDRLFSVRPFAGRIASPGLGPMVTPGHHLHLLPARPGAGQGHAIKAEEDLVRGFKKLSLQAGAPIER